MLSWKHSTAWLVDCFFLFFFFSYDSVFRIRIRIDFGRLDPDPHWECGAESSRTTRTHKNRKKFRNFFFWSAGCSLLRGEGFWCCLDVLYGGLGISKLQLFIKNINFFVSCKFCLVFGHQNLDLDPDPHWPKTLDPDPRWNQFNADPKHWYYANLLLCPKSDWLILLHSFMWYVLYNKI